MKALILDDDTTYLLIIKTLLGFQLEQIEYLQLTDPVESIKLLQSEEGKSYDTIFLDINMPKITGWEFLDELSKLNIHKNIFILTSSIYITDFEMSQQYPDIKGYYVKPIKKEQVAAIISYK